MASYMIVNIEVTDPEAFERYRLAVPPLIAKHGGRYLVRGGETHVLEGDRPWQRVVVLEFPSRAQAEAFYADPDYAPLLALRLGCTRSEMVMVDGYAP
jgi:uncharacterized protein (DUF1330 family)